MVIRTHDNYYNRLEANEAIRDFLKVVFEDEIKPGYNNLSVKATSVRDSENSYRVQIKVEWDE